MFHILLPDQQRIRNSILLLISTFTLTLSLPCSVHSQGKPVSVNLDPSTKFDLEGSFWVLKDQKWGLLGSNGGYIISPQFKALNAPPFETPYLDHGFSYSNWNPVSPAKTAPRGTLLTFEDGSLNLLSPAGRFLFSENYDYIDQRWGAENRLFCSKGGQISLFDTLGRHMCSFEAIDYWLMEGDRILVKRLGREKSCDLLNLKGEVLNKEGFTDMKPLGRGFIRVERQFYANGPRTSLFGAIDKEGKIVVPLDYRDFFEEAHFHDGVPPDTLWLLDLKGEYDLYSSDLEFLGHDNGEGSLVLEIDDRPETMDQNGLIRIEAKQGKWKKSVVVDEVEYVRPSSWRTNGIRVSILSEKGQTFNDDRGATDGYLVYRRGDKYGTLDNRLNEVIPAEYTAKWMVNFHGDFEPEFLEKLRDMGLAPVISPEWKEKLSSNEILVQELSEGQPREFPFDGISPVYVLEKSSFKKAEMNRQLAMQLEWRPGVLTQISEINEQYGANSTYPLDTFVRKDMWGIYSPPSGHFLYQLPNGLKGLHHPKKGKVLPKEFNVVSPIGQSCFLAYDHGKTYCHIFDGSGKVLVEGPHWQIMRSPKGQFLGIDSDWDMPHEPFSFQKGSEQMAYPGARMKFLSGPKKLQERSFEMIIPAEYLY